MLVIVCCDGATYVMKVVAKNTERKKKEKSIEDFESRQQVKRVWKAELGVKSKYEEGALSNG